MTTQSPKPNPSPFRRDRQGVPALGIRSLMDGLSLIGTTTRGCVVRVCLECSGLVLTYPDDLRPGSTPSPHPVLSPLLDLALDLATEHSLEATLSPLAVRLRRQYPELRRLTLCRGCCRSYAPA